jgi:hypothetical protein
MQQQLIALRHINAVYVNKVKMVPEEFGYYGYSVGFGAENLVKMLGDRSF